MSYIDQKKILKLALYAGEIMLANGSETYRVEDTMVRICNACGIPYVDTFITPTGIFLSLDDGSEDSDVHTYIKRTKSRAIDLDKISRVNQFSRTFSETDLSIEDGLLILHDIDKLKPFPMGLRVLGATIGASFFSLMLGASQTDFLITMFIAFFTYFFSLIVLKYNVHAFFRTLTSCFFVSILTLASTLLFSGVNISIVIISGILIFLPGVAITNAVRDALSGDTLSSVTRATEAFITAVAIACGVAISFKIWLYFGGVL